MCKADGLVCRLKFSLGGIVGFSCAIVSTWKCVMTYISKKGPMYGLKLSYQLVSGMAKIVMDVG